MALLTLENAMKELGFKSVQSVRDLDAAGHITIVHLPPTAGAKRTAGPPRVDSEDIERLKQSARQRAIEIKEARAALAIPSPDGKPVKPKRRRLRRGKPDPLLTRPQTTLRYR